MQSLDSSPGHQITKFTSGLIAGFHWSLDGKNDGRVAHARPFGRNSCGPQNGFGKLKLVKRDLVQLSIVGNLEKKTARPRGRESHKQIFLVLNMLAEQLHIALSVLLDSFNVCAEHEQLERAFEGRQFL